MRRQQPGFRLVLSCEHGGNEVPAAYRQLFRRAGTTLATHRGLDIGALGAARYLQRRFGAPLVYATVTRLLADLNRSEGHPRLYSEFSRALPREAREALLAAHYHPYRDEVHRVITRNLAAGGSVLHLSMHSFTPVLQGETRNAELGLLYDPERPLELRFCRVWQRRLRELLPEARIRRNYPYHGAADGFQRVLRRNFQTPRYVAVELEVNQGLAGATGRFPRALLQSIAASLALVVRQRNRREIRR